MLNTNPNPHTDFSYISPYMIKTYPNPPRISAISLYIMGSKYHFYLIYLSIYLSERIHPPSICTYPTPPIYIYI